MKNVIFLGAGASASEGAPIQSKIFYEYFTYKSLGRQNIDPHLTNYFNSFWKIDVLNNLSQVEFPTFEEALGMLELARDRQEFFNKLYNTPSANKIDHTIEDLIFLIAEILKVKLETSNIHHNSLIEKMINNGYIKKTAFISLNYDILIDNAITLKQNRIDLDYGIDFENYNFGDWPRPDPKKSIKLYKIHGSLNWLYCPVCKKIRITPLEKSVTGLINKGWRNRRCRLCRGLYIPLLIPPTFFKVMSNPYLVQIWDGAEQILKTCEKIIFCGYSLPDADIHIKYLLKRGVLNRRNEHPEIVVINNHIGRNKSVKDEEKTRYIRLFGERHVKYTVTSFNIFSTQPGRYLIK